MEEQILVALRRHDRIEEVIPYLEKIVRPRMEVVFLFPYPVELSLWWRDHWVVSESRREALLAGKKIMDNYNWELQVGLAERKISRWREALSRSGVNVAVDLYAGSLRRAVKHYMASGDIRLIMMPAGNSYPLWSLLHRPLLFFGLLRQSGAPAVLLVSPSQT